MSRNALYPCFLGPYGENDELFERLAIEFLRDHVFWRRNFHPEDPPVIPTSAAQDPQYQAFSARLRRELHALSAALKRSVPFFSPRYIGHMASDLLLPGLLAQLITLPYNPNNVVDDGGPVTVGLEISVGLQLARMLGFPADEARPDCAFGYLAAGGTTANYHALHLALALKQLAPALRAGLATLDEDLQCTALPGSLRECDDDTLGHLTPDAAIALSEAWRMRLAEAPPAERARLHAAVQAERAETLGSIEYARRHPALAEPLVFVPVTAHYSWKKAMKLLGLGTAQLRHVPEQRMRLDADALDAELEQAQRKRKPVLAVIGVLGTTEFGTLDPLDRLVDARDRLGRQGLGFSVHVDAAWGGYLATLFRGEDGGLLAHAEVREGFRYFPSTEVYNAFASLARTDSVTVDPHKLGYLPYGAGAFVCRDHRAMHVLAEDADYVFNRKAGDGYRATFRALGRYIHEGSKSGAAAAGAYVTHRVLPLDSTHFGRIPRETVRATEYFYDRLKVFAAEIADKATLCIPFEPDSNLVCLAINPRGNRSLATMNRFTRRLYDGLCVEPDRPVQVREFYGSLTALHAATLGPHDTARVLGELGIDASSLASTPDPESGQDDRILILRHTLMNPFLINEDDGINYLDGYVDYLKRAIE